MDIVWFGNSCFRLQSNQATVLTDPFGSLPPNALSGVQIVTVSDRALRDRIPPIDGARIVDGPGEYEIKGVPVNGLAVTGAGAAAGEPARHTFIYTVTLDGIAVCHLGRLAEPPTGPRIQEMGQADVLFVPLGEPHGLPVPRAVQLASQLEAKLLVPMTLGGPADGAALEAFCKELGADPNARENRLSVTATGLAAQTRVAILTPQGGA
jgi:L-ascorbate metabolism protein UlaG (beta-lactamase superfamily)